MPSDPDRRLGDFLARLEAGLSQVPDDQRRPPPQARVGAVLVLVEDTPIGPRLVLTRRRGDLSSHPGQVSFAGGRAEPGEAVERAALREAREEIGLEAGSVEILGTAPRLYVPPSRFWVLPVVARWVRPHELAANPREVDEILRVPLAALLERDRWRKVPLSLRGPSWAWQLDGELLWGATAAVVSRLLSIALGDWSRGMQPSDLEDDLAVRPWESAPPWSPGPRLGGDLPVVAQDTVLHVTATQMRAVDDRLEAMGLRLSSLVEQAGRALTEAVRRLGPGGLGGLGVTVLAGPGGNGAGGLAAARLLDAAGSQVQVLLTGRPRLADQVRLLREAGVDVGEVATADDLQDPPAGLVVDAMLGYGTDPPLRGRPAMVEPWLRRHDVRVVSLDLPSGVSADEGVAGLCVAADVTVTLAAPKVALRSPLVRPFSGDVYLADIGVPPAVWSELDLEMVDPFGEGPLVRLLPPGVDAGPWRDSPLEG